MILQRSLEGLYLLQRVRDEAHRFAITAAPQAAQQGHDDVRARRRPGARPGAQAALLRHFGSVKRLRAASVEEIASVQGMGDRTAQAVVAALAVGRRRGDGPGARVPAGMLDA